MTEKSRLLDAYDIKARLIPAALCAIPAVVLYHYLLQAHFGGLFTELSHVRFLGYLTVEAALTYLIMQLNNRFVGKLLQNLIFGNDRMPTTEILMPDNSTLTTQTKRDIASKFKKDFRKDLPLFDKSLTEAVKRRRVTELMAHIRQVTRKDMLVKNHNIEYGFIRNLCGGSFGSVAICLVNILVFGLVKWDGSALGVSIVFLVIYGFFVFMSKCLISYFGRNYAKVLFEQYLCL